MCPALLSCHAADGCLSPRWLKSVGVGLRAVAVALLSVALMKVVVVTDKVWQGVGAVMYGMVE